MSECTHKIRARFESGPHTGERCEVCGLFLGWLPKAVTLEGSRTFVMPFGRYKGQIMATLPRDYLEWCIQNLKGSIQRRAITLLHAGGE